MLTGLNEIDQLFFGLPNGMTTFYGPPGSGKTFLANQIAKKKETLYFYGEDSHDAPDYEKYPNIKSVDFMTWKFSPHNSVINMLALIQEYKPELVIVDSMTTILGAGNPAVPEASVRTNVRDLADQVSGILPVIAINETRYSGSSPAGGLMVTHSGIMVVYFAKISIEKPWEVEQYKRPRGSRIWTIEVEKDRDGKAATRSAYEISYIGNEPVLEPILAGL